MHVTLVTPADKRSRSGNRTTAARWATILRDLGHRVQLTQAYHGGATDLLIALHAWRSAGSIAEFRRHDPERPLIVGLGGTDIYRFLGTDSMTVLRSLELADALVGLHDLVGEAIPARFRDKLVVVHQSARPLPRRDPARPRRFDVLVIGHLRDEKDPLRTAEAARLLPASSRLRVVHLGRAHNQGWADRARAEMAANPRYRWLGDVPHWMVRRALARAPAMVLSSRMEGGANVISEAVAAAVPVLASDIPGNVGLLGRDYPGYFPVGDTGGLARLLLRAESDPAFLAALRRACAARAPLFDPARERAAWRALLGRVCSERDRFGRVAARQDVADRRRPREAQRM
jgi:putative glycosyltransferase (TIGR04348 family)